MRHMLIQIKFFRYTITTQILRLITNEYIALQLCPDKDPSSKTMHDKIKIAVDSLIALASMPVVIFR